jgi:hypothetical protein
MRRQLSPRGHHSGTRLVRRLERATYGLNPYLLALAVLLAALNVTWFIAKEVSPPKPVDPDVLMQVSPNASR